MQGLMWECTCGHVVNAEESPEECVKCGKLDTFMQLPEDVLKSREQDVFEDDEPLDAMPRKPLKTSKSQAVKLKKAKTKSGRKK